MNSRKFKVIKIIGVVLAITAICGVCGIISGCKNKNPIDTSPNLTVIRINAGREISEQDLKDVENIVNNVANGKFKNAEKTAGVENIKVSMEDITNENGEQFEPEIGERLILNCKLLTESERLEIQTQIASLFNINHDYEKIYNQEFEDLFRPE